MTMTCRTCDDATQRLGRFAPALTFLALATAALVMLMAVVANAGTMQASWRLAIGGAAVAAGDKVLLGEIAQPVGELPEAHWKTLARTELWPAPANRGEQYNIARAKLERLLSFHLGDLAQLCVVSGPLTVQRGGRLMGAQDIEAAVVETLTPHIVRMRGEVSLRDFRLPSEIFMADDQNFLTVEVGGQFAPGRLSLILREQNPADITVRKYGGTVFLDQWLSVPCAARPINVRDAVTPDVVTFQRKNAAYLRGEPWDGVRFGQMAIRPMGAGEVIYKANLDDVPLISRGDTVSLVYEGRFVRLTASAEALADGRAGESIPVRNMQSRREIVAEVRDGGTVVVR